MKTVDLEERMRELEWYHQLRVPRGMWIVLRVDGRSFSKLTEDMRLEKPFDKRLSDWMVITASWLRNEFDALYAYTESDEISVLLPSDFDMFGRSVEKLVSISAGAASSSFTEVASLPGTFDSRVIMLPNFEEVQAYFSWRQADAARCALNGYVYWTMRKNGHTARQATSAMKEKDRTWKHDFLHGFDINFNDLPTWQRRGVGVYTEEYEHIGHNPLINEDVPCVRRRGTSNYDLPLGEEYRSFLAVLALGGS